MDAWPYLLGIVLLGLAVFFLPRWIRTIIAVVAFTAVMLWAVGSYASYGKSQTFFNQLHYGVGRLSKSLAKDLECGDTTRVAVVLGQLATQGTNGTASEYNRFVWRLVGEVEDKSRNVVATSTNLPAPTLPNEYR